VTEVSPEKPVKARRPRRAKSTTESLLSIVLILEATILFFTTLTVFGLKALPPALAFGGGGLLIAVLVVTSLLVRWRWGVWLGWVLQAAILATGFLVPIMFLVGGGFVALWIWCFVRARDIDRRRAEFLASSGSSPDSPSPSDPATSTQQGDRP
jgi:hypothetical protein